MAAAPERASHVFVVTQAGDVVAVALTAVEPASDAECVRFAARDACRTVASGSTCACVLPSGELVVGMRDGSLQRFGGAVASGAPSAVDVGEHLAESADEVARILAELDVTQFEKPVFADDAEGAGDDKAADKTADEAADDEPGDAKKRKVAE